MKNKTKVGQENIARRTWTNVVAIRARTEATVSTLLVAINAHVPTVNMHQLCVVVYIVDLETYTNSTVQVMLCHILNI